MSSLTNYDFPLLCLKWLFDRRAHEPSMKCLLTIVRDMREGWERAKQFSLWRGDDDMMMMRIIVMVMGWCHNSKKKRGKNGAVSTWDDLNLRPNFHSLAVSTWDHPHHNLWWSGAELWIWICVQQFYNFLSLAVSTWDPPPDNIGRTQTHLGSAGNLIIL